MAKQVSRAPNTKGTAPLGQTEPADHGTMAPPIKRRPDSMVRPVTGGANGVQSATHSGLGRGDSTTHLGTAVSQARTLRDVPHSATKRGMGRRGNA